MTATAARPDGTTAERPSGTPAAPASVRLDRAEGVELLGPVHGCGYRDGACLVRRADGQMVQLGQLMYALLECVNGERDGAELAAALTERIGRRVEGAHVLRIAQKLAQQGLLAGTEQHAPPRRNPLLALRWKVLVTNPVLTRRLTSPFAFLFRPWLMWPILAAFVAVFWFVLIHKGVAAATAEAFHSPGLLLLVFALGVVSAGFHELGHAAACRYGGATPGGMGMGLYLVWPAFYTDVTDAYRLPRRARLRIDLAGLYFNAVVAVLTMAVWLAWRSDALLLLVALQILQMVKQLSPMIRADGYHILSDATGVPDLYSHMGPTLRRLLPGHRDEPSALTGRARIFVTVWVLIIVPILLTLTLGAILLLPRVAATAWQSGHYLVAAIPHQVSHGQVIDVLASLVRLLALCLPVLGCALVTQKIARSTVGRARDWSRGRPLRRVAVVLAAVAAGCAAAWAWWASGQYRPIRATQGGTIGSLARLVSDPTATARPASAPAPVALSPGVHLAMAMIPVGGATARHPALFIVRGGKGKPAVVIVSGSAPPPPAVGTHSPGGTGSTPGAAAGTTSPVTGNGDTTTTATGTPASPGASTPSSPATAFPFTLPSAPPPGGTQALAENRTNGGGVYDVAYSLVTVSDGAPVTQTNSAYALAHCQACTTVAVSFQVVLVVGRSRIIAPINAAGSLNYDCPACTTTALADQLVVTLSAQPSSALMAKLNADLQALGALPALGAQGTPAAVATEVGAVQQQIETELNNSGLLTTPISSGSTAGSPASSGSSTSSVQTSTGSASGTGSGATTGTTTPSPGSSSSASATTTSSSTTTTSTGSSPTATSTSAAASPPSSSSSSAASTTTSTSP